MLVRRKIVPRLGFWEILIIAFIILLLFGANRIPEMMRGLARGLRGFKEEMKSEDKPAEAPPQGKPKAN
jgi:sec-independent protein translocase protein TatA